MRVINISRMGQLPDEQNSGILGDIGTDLQMAGGAALQQTAALGDFVARPFRSEGDETFSERLAGKGEDTVGSDAWMARKQAQYSPARQQAERDYQETVNSNESELGKLGATAYGLAANPRALLGRVVQSAPTFAMAAIPGGVVGAGLRAAGAGTKAIATGARLGAAAGEGIQSGAQNAYDAINYNVANGRDRYEGVGGAQAITAIGVGATSLLGGKIGGGIEAGLFNKEVRQGFQTGWKGTGRAALAEGAEEGVQSTFEMVPQNIALDRPWNEGLGQNVGEGAIAGAAMGGGFHAILRPGKPESLVQGANKSPEIPQTEQPVEAGQTNVPNNEAQPAPEPMPEPAPVEIPEPTPQQAAVNEAVAETPMAGTQPVPEPVVPQAPQEDPEVTKLREAQAAQETYRQAYGDEPSRAKEISKGELKADSVWRQANPEDVEKLDTLVKANVVSGAHKTPKALRDLAYTHHSYQGTELADKFDRLSNEAKNPTEAGFFAAAAELIRHPDADLSHFMQDRAKAATQAMGEQAAQQNAKAEAELKPKAEKKPAEERVPLPEEWETMSSKARNMMVRRASGSQNEAFKKGVLTLDQSYKEHQKKQNALKADKEARAKAYLAATKDEELRKSLKEAGLIDTRLKDIPMQSIETPEFQKKVLALHDAKHIEAVKKLLGIAQAYDPSYKLNLPTEEQVRENAVAAAKKKDEQEMRANKKVAANAQKAKKEVKAHNVQVPDTVEGKRDALVLSAYFEENYDDAKAEAEELGPIDKKTRQQVIATAVRAVFREGYAKQRERYLKYAADEGIKSDYEDRREDAEKFDTDEVLADRAQKAADEKLKHEAEEEMKKRGYQVETEFKENVSTSDDPVGFDEAEESAQAEEESKAAAEEKAAAAKEDVPEDERTPEKKAGRVNEANYNEDGLYVGKGGFTKSRTEAKLADADAEGVLAEVKKLYKEATLPDLGKSPEGALQTFINGVEKPLIANLPKKVNAEMASALYIDYMDFMQSQLGDMNETFRDQLIQGSPVMQWILEQYSKTSGNLQAAAANQRVQGVKRVNAMQIADLVRKRGGDGGWFKLETFANIRKDLMARKRSPEAQKIFEKAFYWRGIDAEGVAVPLRFAAETSKHLVADLSTIVSPNTARTVAYAVECFRREGVPLPDTYVVDLSRQVMPSRVALGISGLEKATFGFQGTVRGQGQSLFTGKMLKSEWHNAVHYSIAETPANGATLEEASKAAFWKNAGVHELIHAIDDAYYDQTGVSLCSEFHKKVLPQHEKAYLALLMLSHAASLETRGFDPYEGFRQNPDLDTPKVREIYASLSQDEKAALSYRFDYPANAIDNMEEQGVDEVKIKQAFQKELLAVYLSSMVEEQFPARLIRGKFPSLAKITDDLIGAFKYANKRHRPIERAAGSYAQSRIFAAAYRIPETDQRVGSEKESGSREARIEQHAKEVVWPAGEAEAHGVDPKIYETEEGKKLIRTLAEAITDKHSADGSVGAARAKLKKEDTPENHQALQDAIKKQAAAKVVMDQAQKAFDDYENAQKKPVAPVKGTLVEQSNEQFPYDARINKIQNPKVREIARSLASFIFHKKLGLMFTRDLVDTGKKYLKSAEALYATLNKIAQEGRMWQDKAMAIGQAFNKLSQEERDRVNDCLLRSTVDGKWFALPKRAPKNVKVTPDAEFAKLSPEGKKVYTDVLQMGIESRRRYLAATLQNIREKYADLVSRHPNDTEDLVKERDHQYALAKGRIGESSVPYVPLRRFGKYVVVMKTQAYVDKLQEFRNAKELSEKDGASARSKKEMRRLYDELMAMQQDGENYVVEYAETAEDAVRRRGELERDLGGKAAYFEREYFARNEQLNLQQLLNLSDRAARMADGSDGAVDKVSQSIKDHFDNIANLMYIQSLSDKSAMKSRLHRRKVAGHSEDMMRAFMETASAESRLFGHMKYGPKMRKNLSAMHDELRTTSNRAVATAIFNELRERLDQDIQPQSTFSNGVLRTTSLWMLLTNPAFFIQNLTQPLMYSAAYASGRHGMYRPLTETSKQMLEVAKWLKEDGTLSDLDKLVEEKKITPWERKMLVQMRENGLLDIGLSQDFGEFNRSTMSPAMQKLVGMTDWLAKGARKVEIVNRAATALVAYRLEFERLKKEKKSDEEAHRLATRFADHVLYETHGDYSSQNAPRYFKANDFMRLATQFRKFQLIQLGLFTRMLRQSLAKMPSEERKFARVGLRNTLMLFMAMTGLKGLPFYAPIGLALSLFAGGPGDDDEDYLRKTMAEAGLEKPFIDALTRGIPAALGLDVSEKVGAGNTLSPFPYLDAKTWLGNNGEDDALKILAAVAGPWASLGTRFARGAEYYHQGDYTKMWENILPTGLSNTIKAARFGLEGMTSKNGDVMIPGEQFSFGDLVMQAAGLPTTEITSRNQKMGSLLRHEEAFNLKAKQIRYDYQQAVKDHNTAERNAAMRAWQAMNAERRAQGFAMRPMQNLISSVNQQRKRESSVIGGLATNKSNRNFVKKLDELY